MPQKCAIPIIIDRVNEYINKIKIDEIDEADSVSTDTFTSPVNRFACVNNLYENTIDYLLNLKSKTNILELNNR